jgi:hypothetical protein
MRKLPIGPTIVAVALLGLIGAFLLLPGKKPAGVETFSVVTAAGADANMVQAPANAGAVVPTASASPTPTLAPGEDPPVHREPGAINYADKGVVPAL